MKKILLIVLLIINIGFYSQSVSAQESGVSLGMGKHELLESLGEPKKETLEDGYTVLWYDSIAPSFGTFYFIDNTGKTVFISLNKKDENILLKTYIDQYDNPELSIKRYSDDLADSLRQHVHIWPDQGMVVITGGPVLDSPVLREMQFDPVSLDEYFDTWGKDFEGNTEVAIQSNVAVRDSRLDREERMEKEEDDQTSLRIEIIIGVIVIISLVFVMVVGLFVKKKWKVNKEKL
ncbi:hypothetical protein ACFL1P_01290 [Patescibacteria group bacterium]